MPPTVFERIAELLHGHGVSFEVLRHEAVYTSADAASIRGTSLASGAKALVCRGDGQFLMFVIPADRKLDSKHVRQERHWKSLRFADRDEVRTLTGLEPGAIPPFGSLFLLPTLCDERLRDSDRINFNAGDHSISISMRFEDFLSVEKPQLGRFAAAPAP